jgi:hypothetical protein
MSQTENRTEQMKSIISDFLEHHEFKLLEIDHKVSAGKICLIAEYTGANNICEIPLYLKILEINFKKEWIYFALNSSDILLLNSYNRKEANNGTDN